MKGSPEGMDSSEGDGPRSSPPVALVSLAGVWAGLTMAIGRFLTWHPCKDCGALLVDNYFLGSKYSVGSAANVHNLVVCHPTQRNTGTWIPLQGAIKPASGFPTTTVHISTLLDRQSNNYEQEKNSKLYFYNSTRNKRYSV